MHIYLECGDGAKPQEKGSGLFNYRGESDDYESFSQKMADAGLKVIATNEFKGDKKIPLKVLEA